MSEISLERYFGWSASVTDKLDASLMSVAASLRLRSLAFMRSWKEDLEAPSGILLVIMAIEYECRAHIGAALKCVETRGAEKSVSSATRIFIRSIGKGGCVYFEFRTIYGVTIWYVYIISLFSFCR